MDVISELVKERYAVKKTNPLRADVVIPMILYEAKEIARKNKKEQVSQADVQASAKSYLKKLENTLKSYEDLPSSGPLERLKAEMLEVKTFLPSTLNEEETRKLLSDKLGLVKLTSNQFGPILKELPENVDKGLASKILKEFT